MKSDLAYEYPTINDPSHECEERIDGVLCMERAAGAVWWGFEPIWLCEPHLQQALDNGWDRYDEDLP